MGIRLSPEMYWQIVNAHRADPARPYAAIGRATTPRPVSRHAVHDIITRYNLTGDPVPRRGVPRPTAQRLNQQHVDALVQYVGEHPFAKLATIREDTGIQASDSTITRRLKEAGIRVYRPARKPRMTQHHRDERLAFAAAYGDLDWTTVMFSDETSFTTSREEAGFVRRARGQRYRAENLRETRQAGRVTVGVWASITNDGLGEIYRIKGRLCSKDYKNRILKNKVAPWFRDNPDQIFQHDNAPAHSAVHVRNYLQMTKKINVLSWPPCSPDLSPIENFWVIFKREVGVVDPGEGNVERKQDAYWEVIKAAWDRMKSGDKSEETTQTIKRYYQGMPNRLVEVRNAAGGPTRR